MRWRTNSYSVGVCGPGWPCRLGRVGANMRRQSVQVPRHIGAWIAKWLFVVAALTMPIVIGAASGDAQDFANQPQVQAASKRWSTPRRRRSPTFPPATQSRKLKTRSMLRSATTKTSQINHTQTMKRRMSGGKRNGTPKRRKTRRRRPPKMPGRKLPMQNGPALPITGRLSRKGVPPERSCRPRSLQCVTRLREPGPPFSELGRTGLSARYGCRRRQHPVRESAVPSA